MEQTYLAASCLAMGLEEEGFERFDRVTSIDLSAEDVETSTILLSSKLETLEA